MNVSKESTSANTTSSNSGLSRFSRHLQRLNQTDFMQTMNMYLHTLVLPVQIISLSYSMWQRKKGKPEEKEEVQTEFEDEESDQELEENDDAPLLKPVNEETVWGVKFKTPARRREEIEQLVEQEKKEALLHEQQEAWILKITGKKV